MEPRDRQRWRRELEALRDQTVAKPAEKISPNRDDGSTRTDDDAQPLNEMNQVIASRRNRLRQGSLAQINAALAKLGDDPEMYGLCEECEEPIGEKRLSLMPYAEYCVSCQRRHDEQRGAARRSLTDFRS
ncbi:MAG: TraR/DksA C4-type zinc finger protein [Deltaproteobacteria bacterium]|nr:TraR/DksA C4-type zinc finger protein [Deltaproteobacteria bacterium]